MVSLKRVVGSVLSTAVFAAALAVVWGAAPATAPATPKGPPRMPKVVATADPIVDTPTTMAALQAMQKKVEAVVKKALPATVAILTSDGEGSGIIISKDGLILTAAHVIEKPNLHVTVVFPDGQKAKAITLGTNHLDDTGMLKITKPGDYPFVDVGQSGALVAGEWVVALGHPGGYQEGRPPVARLGRVLTASKTGAVQLRTDCTLIMGDSGGPLLDLDGNVVGIHSRISQGTTENMHVPVDLFITSWTRLARGDDWGGAVDVALRPAWLGISVEDDANGCKVTQLGILNPPSEKAGLKVGDVVQKFDGEDVGNSEDLLDLLETARVGRETTIEVLRNGAKLTLKITPVPHP